MGAISMSVVGSGVALSLAALFAAQPNGPFSAAAITPVAVESIRAAEEEVREAARVEAEQSRHGDDDSDNGLNMRLPEWIPYREVFQKYGDRMRVEPALLAAIAMQESSFNPWAGCDRRGAGKGIMQIENQPKYCGPGAVEASVEKAAIMLADYHSRSGSWEAAAFAFNNGPGLMDEWVRYSGDRGKIISVLADYYNRPPHASNRTKSGYATWGQWRARVAYSYASPQPLPGFRSATQTWLIYRQG